MALMSLVPTFVKTGILLLGVAAITLPIVPIKAAVFAMAFVLVGVMNTRGPLVTRKA